MKNAVGYLLFVLALVAVVSGGIRLIWKSGYEAGFKSAESDFLKRVEETTQATTDAIRSASDKLSEQDGLVVAGDEQDAAKISEMNDVEDDAAQCRVAVDSLRALDEIGR